MGPGGGLKKGKEEICYYEWLGFYDFRVKDERFQK
jgi:hypothetical protein